jgi:hypothetical protein
MAHAIDKATGRHQAWATKALILNDADFLKRVEK